MPTDTLWILWAVMMFGMMGTVLVRLTALETEAEAIRHTLARLHDKLDALAIRDPLLGAGVSVAYPLEPFMSMISTLEVGTSDVESDISSLTAEEVDRWEREARCWGRGRSDR